MDIVHKPLVLVSQWCLKPCASTRYSSAIIFFVAVYSPAFRV